MGGYYKFAVEKPDFSHTNTHKSTAYTVVGNNRY